MSDPKKTRPVLVIGATGYIGGRLVPKLLELGYTVRVMGRSMSKLESRPWATHPRLEAVQGDMLDLSSIRRAVRGCWATFYLVHSLNAPRHDFAYLDRLAAWNMVEASVGSTLERIIYLGGLGDENDPTLSKHLRSRLEVARILRSGPVPATTLRAAMILGSGSASFEILRYLVDRLPVMVTPPWVHTPVQPVCIRNVLNYLVGCLEHEETVGQAFDIGGPEILTYERLIKIYAQAAGLRKRVVIPVSFISPRLSALWISLVTPVPAPTGTRPDRRAAEPGGVQGRTHTQDNPAGTPGLPAGDRACAREDRAASGRSLLERCGRASPPRMDLLRR